MLCLSHGKSHRDRQPCSLANKSQTVSLMPSIWIFKFSYKKYTKGKHSFHLKLTPKLYNSCRILEGKEIFFWFINDLDKHRRHLILSCSEFSYKNLGITKVTDMTKYSATIIYLLFQKHWWKSPSMVNRMQTEWILPHLGQYWSTESVPLLQRPSSFQSCWLNTCSGGKTWQAVKFNLCVS